MDFRFLDLIATVIDFCTPAKERGRGHPRSATVRVLATLRQFLREGTPWRSLTASAGKVSGSTLRRHLEQWAGMGVLAQVHGVLVGMLRGDPTLILDTCSVRAKRAAVLNYHERIGNKIACYRTRKDSNFKPSSIFATMFQIEKCCHSSLPCFNPYVRSEEPSLRPDHDAGQTPAGAEVKDGRQATAAGGASLRSAPAGVTLGWLGGGAQERTGQQVGWSKAERSRLVDRWRTP